MKLNALVATIVFLAGTPAVARAQLVTTMMNQDGSSLPCITIGPLAPFAQEYCVRRTEAEGAVKKSELGASGLSLGLDGDLDGVVTAVAAGSPAAVAGLAAGDAVVAVDGRAVQRPPGDVADQLTFGAAGTPVRLTIQRGAQTFDVSFIRAVAPEPPGTPHSPNLLIGIHPVVNWRGQFIPCMGAGVLGPAVISGCQSHFARAGYVKVTALGATGVTFDAGRRDAAVVASVAPGSTAEAAGVKPGDVVTRVDGRALAASRGQEAERLLFGKAGTTRQIAVARAGTPIRVSIVLEPSR